MKHYVKIKHVSSDISKIFEEKLNKVVEEFQNNGYLVDIQQGFNGKVFSAIVSAYAIKQRGDILPTLED